MLCIVFLNGKSDRPWIVLLFLLTIGNNYIEKTFSLLES